MIKTKISLLLIGILACMDAMAARPIKIADRFYQSAISAHVPTAKQPDVTSAWRAAGADVTVTEMADISDAGFKSSPTRLSDAVKFLDAILSAEMKYQAAAQDCQKLKGHMQGDECVGADGYKLVYGAVCPEGAICVTEFSTAITNMRYVISEYITGYAAREGLQLTCLDTYRMANNKYYLQCSARGMPYEFEFASLVASDALIAATRLPDLSDVDTEFEDIVVEDEFVPLVDEITGIEPINPVAAGTFCPASGNALKSITDKTKVDDNCASAYIASGVVFMRANGTCSCRATACVDGRAPTSGVCCAADKTWDATAKKCVESAPADAATKDETASDAAGAEQSTEIPEIAVVEINYLDVCDEQKGQGTCVNKVFHKVKVTPVQAVALSKLYARKQGWGELICADVNNMEIHRKYPFAAKDKIPCVSSDRQKHYTFVFNSLNSGSNKFLVGLCAVWGLEDKDVWRYTTCNTDSTSICAEIDSALKSEFDITSGTSAQIITHDGKKYCRIITGDTGWMRAITVGYISIDSLNRISGIDPMHFYDAGIKLNHSGDVYEALKDYMFKTQGMPPASFECSNTFTAKNVYQGTASELYQHERKYNDCFSQLTGEAVAYAKSYCGDGPDTKSVKGDVLTCDYNGQKVDFVFKSLAAWLKLNAKQGTAGLQCISNDGAYTQKRCVGVTESECYAMGDAMRQSDPTSAGVKWKDEMCILVDARRAANLNTTVKIGGKVVQWTVVSVSGGPLAWALVGVDVAATATNVATEMTMQKWADEFLRESKKCQGRDYACADLVLDENISKLIAGEYQFNESALKSVSSEMNRLIEMLPEETWTRILQAASDAAIIAQVNDENESTFGNLIDNAVRDGLISEDDEVTEESIAKLAQYYLENYYVDQEVDIKKVLENYYGRESGAYAMRAANKTAKIVSIVATIGQTAAVAMRQICGRFTCFPNGVAQKPIAQNMVRAGIFRKTDVIRAINKSGRSYDIIRGMFPKGVTDATLKTRHMLHDSGRLLWRGVKNYGFNNTIWAVIGF